MDVLYSREQSGYWNPDHVDSAPRCDAVEVDDDELPRSLHAFAPERFVPCSQLIGRCPEDVIALSDKDRLMAAGRAALAAAWARLADGIVIISLRESSGRRARLAEELRMAGVLPENEDRAFWYITDRPREDFEAVEPPLVEARGRFGCMRSHIAVTVEAERRAWKRWVVFEDDSVFAAEVAAGPLHNAADAMDADPEIAIVALGCTFMISAESGRHEARGLFPVVRGGGTQCLACTPILTAALAPLRQIYGDPQERREATRQEIAGYAGPPASDEVFYRSDFIKARGGVYQLRPNLVEQQGATTIGYDADVRIGGWALRTLGLGRFLKNFGDPAYRNILLTAAGFVFMLLVVIVLLIIRDRKALNSK
jgi:hypothetical protein